MASVAVGNLIVKLIPLLKDEATLLRDVRDKVNGVTKELSLIQAYLNDADAKAEMADTTSHAVKEWVKQLREAAFRIQDAVDFYLFKVAPKRPQSQRHGIVGALCKIGFVIRTVVPRHKMTSDLVSITATIRRLKEQRETLGLSPLAENGVANTPPARTRLDLRMGAHFLEDDELVGVDDTKSLLNDWLINGQSTRTVIAVVGEGGLGKTTIVKNLYNKLKETISFECCAWITVSRTFHVEHLLKTLLQSLYENDGNKYAANKISEKAMDNYTLTKKLREYLKGRNYMVIFDDVWAIDFWGGVEFALPINNNNRCRIIITTRDKGVAEFCHRSALVHIHELNPLQAEDALNLFLLKTFQFDPEGCPEDLNELFKSFVKKCEGVPLAIVAISGLLSTKMKKVSEWKKVYDSLRSKFSSDPHLKGFYQIISESYYDLPYHLKLCLLYFGLFPEGYTIKRTRLIRLWVAEGFVNENENELCGAQTPDQVAEDYLVELIRRSLVKVFNLHANGGVRSCRVHDLIHDFIIRKCEELNFCQVVKNQQFKFNEWTRRLSINKIHEGSVIVKDQNYGRVRSCIVCDIEQLPDSMLKSLLPCFKLLETLDLEDSPLDHLPEAIGNLLNLKYLSVRNTKIKTIPKFIGRLQKLETLNLRDTQVRELPVEINKLVKLQHLLSYFWDFKASGQKAIIHSHSINSTEQYDFFDVSAKWWRYTIGVKLKGGIGRLTALRSLATVDTVDEDGVLREMENLKNMRRLAILNLSKDKGNIVCNAIKNMPHLCSLSIMAVEPHEVLDLQSLVDPPLYLQRLYLDGRLERFPEWIPKLKHLAKLRMNGSRLAQDPLPALKGLSELSELDLYNFCEGEEIHFKSRWFMKLKSLRLWELDGLTTLKIYKGALPNLEKLWLQSIPQMVKVPDDIQNLEALKELDVYNMPIQFVDDISTKWKENAKLRIFIFPTTTQEM